MSWLRSPFLSVASENFRRVLTRMILKPYHFHFPSAAPVLTLSAVSVTDLASIRGIAVHHNHMHIMRILVVTPVHAF